MIFPEIPPEIRLFHQKTVTIYPVIEKSQAGKPVKKRKKRKKCKKNAKKLRFSFAKIKRSAKVIG